MCYENPDRLARDELELREPPQEEPLAEPCSTCFFSKNHSDQDDPCRICKEIGNGDLSFWVMKH